eukprot:CAMPEP_0180216932 /NCGR_PEP_ID=MMETSP0987-20121128/16591_1 /TAXON_ID=697907 /ORGANISM="non described non described, Strain CCMP2293" /LENGTH=182 /DNA_ID=CAMNT_0022176287 /DNA_START=76 /DNA_END=624 /DNA_ORIENTATION=-
MSLSNVIEGLDEDRFDEGMHAPVHPELQPDRPFRTHRPSLMVGGAVAHKVKHDRWLVVFADIHLVSFSPQRPSHRWVVPHLASELLLDRFAAQGKAPHLRDRVFAVLPQYLRHFRESVPVDEVEELGSCPDHQVAVHPLGVLHQVPCSQPALYLQEVVRRRSQAGAVSACRARPERVSSARA